MARSSVTASSVSRFLSRCGFTRELDFQTRDGRFFIDQRTQTQAVRVWGQDLDGMRKFLEGARYQCAENGYTGELFVLWRNG